MLPEMAHSVIMSAKVGDQRPPPRDDGVDTAPRARLGRPSEEGAPADHAAAVPALLSRVLSASGRADRLTHIEHVPARTGRTAPWPDWAAPTVVERLNEVGVHELWQHQAEAADHAWAGRSVIVATGTASGKSLAYLLPAFSALLDDQSGAPQGSGGPQGSCTPRGTGATALYIAPTKALAADQLRVVSSLDLAGVRAAAYDGDTPSEERDWVRQHAAYVLTNPDMLHRSILPGHPRWAKFLRAVRFVIVDECHHYRGVFGSHVAQVLRRLRRVCERWGSAPVFILASATVSDPATSAERLVGLPMAAVTEDASPRGPMAFALWEPQLTDRRGEHGAPMRRTATAEAADLLADLIVEGNRTLAFVRSRRGAETVALSAKRMLAEVDPQLADRVAAYRAGYLPEERRALEAALHQGELLGLATTSALELGVDVAGLDAVVLAGFPGTRASLWQQAGRAGRAGQAALAVLVARDDPLDTYLVHHPDALFGRPVEATVLDPDNPYVLAPHLCAAAAELPLNDTDRALFGTTTDALLDELTGRGLLRRRSTGWYWISGDRACDLADIRGVGGAPVRVVEESTGRVLGTVDADASHATVHSGAIYLHQGESYLVRQLDLTDAVALVERTKAEYTTIARDITHISILDTERFEPWGDAALHFGSVDVMNQVVSFVRRDPLSGTVWGEAALDLPERRLRTRAVWWTVSDDQLAAAALPPADVPGAAHGAEHASIGLLPLFATCDRWDIGGVSTAWHEDTGRATIFVYDGQPGGAGFAERGYHAARAWFTATRDAVAACECEVGCPSCVHSPKCGNGNSQLDKAGAVRLLDVLLRDAPNGPPAE
jgi:DEAD/DEAH box helicase domain-containing protein